MKKIKKLLLGISCLLCSLFAVLGFAITPVKASAASGSFTLEKTTYRQGEEIVVTATGSGKDWIGIFREGETSSILWYYVAERPSSFNILNANPNAGANANNIVAGNYVIAYVPNDLEGISNATQTQHITIVDANAQMYLNKTSFVEGEAINVTAFGSGTDWVGIYREGEVLSARWYYVANAGNGATVNIAAYGNNNASNGISPYITEGNYTVYLIRNDGGYTSAEVAIPITVSAAASPLQVEQTEFQLKQPIYVTATHDDNGAWVGLYRTTESEYCRWYYVKDANGVPYDITQGKTNIETSYSPNVMRGDYYLRLIGSSGAVLHEIAISVVGDPTVPSAPLSATYDLENDTDGFATGTVSVKMPTSDMTDRCIALFWGDDSGIFEDYSYIKFHVTGETTTFTFGKNVFIPYGATKLYVYAKNTNGDALSPTCVTVDLPKGAASKNPLGSDTGKNFWVISDLHIDQDMGHVHNQHFEGAMQDIARIDGDAMSLIINGDMTSRGREGDWSNFQTLCDNATGIPPIVLAMGNHEYYNGSYEAINQKFYALAKYPDGTYVNKMHYDYWQGGYHFVFLGTDEWPQNNTHAVLSQATLSWLDATLDADRDAGKPTFLFLHQPLYNTVAGSRPGEDYSGVEANSESSLRAILADHPEVMLFVGHTHWTMDAEANMYEGTEELPARMFNTSSAGYLWTTYDNASGDYMYGSEGYYIRVYGGTLYVMGYDFVNDEWISAAQYCVKLSSCDTCVNSDNDHYCDVCGEKVRDCVDNSNDSDHNCDICGESCGTHTFDGDKYGWYSTSRQHTAYCNCSVYNPNAMENHYDDNNDHKCDACSYVVSTCQDNDNDHLCDTCKDKLSDCKDNDNNHYCDTCKTQVSDCKDDSYPFHRCDICNKIVSECVDEDPADHCCDICDDMVSGCNSQDGDHVCDICGEAYGNCDDADGDHLCDICKEKLSDCVDTITDHVCDKCGANLGDCQDNDNDHYCDVCTLPISFCTDENPADHFCDICEKFLGSCKDSNNDHYCDACNLWVTCFDNDNNHLCDACDEKVTDCGSFDGDHACDVCGETLSGCEDSDADGYCDVCGEEFVEQHVCVDGDNDHYCDGCGEMLSMCEDSDNDHNCDICGWPQTYCVDDDHNHYCDICDTQLTTCTDDNDDGDCDTCNQAISGGSAGDNDGGEDEPIPEAPPVPTPTPDNPSEQPEKTGCRGTISGLSACVGLAAFALLALKKKKE